jgi:hypothetical protein
MRNFFLSKGFLHLLVALVLLPLQSIIPEVGKFALVPYLLYLVWSKNPLYIPSLIVLIAPGTTIAFAILLSMLLLTLTHFLSLKKRGIGWLLILALMPLPVFLYMTGVRTFSLGVSIVEALKPLGFYLGLFPFFYGVLVAPKVNNTVVSGILFTLFILPLYTLLPFSELTIRAYWFSFPVFFSLVGAKIILRQKFDMKNYWFVLGGIFLIAFGQSLKFTLIFSGLIALIALRSSLKRDTVVLKFLAKPRIILLSVLLVAFMINGAKKFSVQKSNAFLQQDELSYFVWDEFWTLLQFKAFDDRAVIWAGGWDTIIKTELWWTPYDVPQYSYETNKGADIENIEYGIHNIGLELMRNYGIMVGGFITLIYLFFIIQGPGKYLFRNRKLDGLSILASACIGAGLVGALVGQFVLMVTFSLILMSISGILFGIQAQK